MHPPIQEVTKLKYGCLFKGIPNSREKLLSLTIITPIEAYTIQIIDSLQFHLGHYPPSRRLKRKGFPIFYQVF